ncbi:MAG: hypothetical protein OXR68_05895 [Alphaproteobacteria bacterium]|nr:hypothetical protein [Alphaproteobacteria bacterium]MDD9920136.1 hypothetical protein [Alphaproteobacteria bacterium]
MSKNLDKLDSVLSGVRSIAYDPDFKGDLSEELRQKLSKALPVLAKLQDKSWWVKSPSGFIYDNHWEELRSERSNNGYLVVLAQDSTSVGEPLTMGLDALSKGAVVACYSFENKPGQKSPRGDVYFYWIDPSAGMQKVRVPL